MNPVSADQAGVPEAAPGSDQALIAAVLRSDPRACEQFVERMGCVARIVAALNLRGGKPLDDDLLADLAQDTVVIAWSKLSEFRSDAVLENWVYGIACLEFQNARRRRARILRVQVHLPDLEERHSSEEIATEPVDPDEIGAALSQLDPRDADLLRMRHELDMTFDKIGVEVGLPANTVKSRYHRSLGRIREWLRVRMLREEHPR